MLEQILLSEEFVNIIGSLLVIILGFVVKYLKENVKNSTVTKTVDIFERVVNNSVAFVQQTIVDDLKEANADGKLTDEEKEYVKKRAIAAINAQLSTESKEVLAQVFGDIDDIIDKWIESSVTKLKK